jgi:hypothetical protein
LGGFAPTAWAAAGTGAPVGYASDRTAALSTTPSTPPLGVPAKSPTRRLAIETAYAIWEAGRNRRARSTASAAPAAADSRAGEPLGDWATGIRSQLPITSDHFFIFLSVLTIFAPELSGLGGQN